jgi:hypothetical protein
MTGPVGYWDVDDIEESLELLLAVAMPRPAGRRLAPRRRMPRLAFGRL